MIGIAVVIQGLELAGWTGLWWKLKGDAQQQILIHGKPQPQKIPFVDRKLKELAGHPTSIQRAMAQRTIKITRRLTNTRAFEHLVTGFFNRQSRLTKLFEKTTKIRLS